MGGALDRKGKGALGLLLHVINTIVTKTGLVRADAAARVAE